MFCPKCGTILVQKTKRYGCPKCGYSSKEKIKIETSEKMQEKREIGVLKEKDANVWPVTTATCPKCGHDEAFFWSAQMRAGDEAETRFFRCTKCKHTWREYS
ncbi:transcription factor S [Candidatus Pacearchaeota archaeon]|nr:transcription factor S [Candidatus Pacearchaeota archaeon]